MKIFYAFLVGFLLISAVPSFAQHLLLNPDSTLSISNSQPITLDTSQTKVLQKQFTSSFATTRIPVNAGDSISITAVVMDNTSRKGRFWKNLGKAIVPAFILNNLSNKQAISRLYRPSYTYEYN